MMTAPDDAMETVSAEGQDGDGRVSSATLAGKVLCGYQAWFNAEGDGAGAGWRHYFHAGSAFEPSFDLWPDVAELGEDELHESPLRMPTPDGAVGHCARLYSASNASTIDRHFLWMRQFGIDGVFLQRFVNELLEPRLCSVRNRVAASVSASAARHGRAWAIMYDVSGAPADTVLQTIEDDWRAMAALYAGEGSEGYLREQGRPVVGIWGFGFFADPGADNARPDPGAHALVAGIEDALPWARGSSSWAHSALTGSPSAGAAITSISSVFNASNWSLSCCSRAEILSLASWSFPSVVV